MKSDVKKRSFLRDNVKEYFKTLRSHIDDLEVEVYNSVDKFKIEDIVFHSDEKRIALLLINEKYQQLKCAEIATIIPKIEKIIDQENGHFLHIRNYLRS